MKCCSLVNKYILPYFISPTAIKWIVNRSDITVAILMEQMVLRRTCYCIVVYTNPYFSFCYHMQFISKISADEINNELRDSNQKKLRCWSIPGAIIIQPWERLSSLKAICISHIQFDRDTEWIWYFRDEDPLRRMHSKQWGAILIHPASNEDRCGNLKWQMNISAI